MLKAAQAMPKSMKNQRTYVFGRTGALRDASESLEGAFKSILAHALEHTGALLRHCGMPQIARRPAGRASGEPPEPSVRHQDTSPTRSKRQTLFKHPLQRNFVVFFLSSENSEVPKTTTASVLRTLHGCRRVRTNALNMLAKPSFLASKIKPGISPSGMFERQNGQVE